MKTKNLMPASCIDALINWLKSNNWLLQETIATNEVLRCRNTGKGIFILTKTSHPDFYCIYEHHGKDVRNYIKSIK